MNFRTTLILLATLVVVLIVVMFTRDSGTAKTDESATAAKLLDITAPDVTRVAVTNDDGSKFALERANGKWRLIEPVSAAAEDTAANALVDAIVGLQSRGQMDASTETGLSQPRFKLEVAAKGKTIKFDVGSRSGVGNNLYIRRDGQTKADVVQATLYEQLDKPLKQWRRARLMDVAGTEIKQIRVATTQDSFTLEKPDQNWRVAQPTSMPADSSPVSDMAFAISNLHAEEYVTSATDQAKRYGLDQPVMTLSFSTAAPATQPSTSQPAFTTIQFGRFDDVLKKNVFATISGEPGVVKVQATALDAFRKKPIDLRDRALFSVEADKVTKISITTEKPATTQPTTREASHEAIVLARAKKMTAATTGPATTQASSKPAEPPSIWQLASKNDIDADDSKVERALSGMHPFRADRYLETPAPATQPAATITLVIETTDATHEVRMIDPGNGKAVTGMYNGLEFEVARYVLDDLAADFEKKAGLPSTPTPFLPGAMP